MLILFDNPRFRDYGLTQCNSGSRLQVIVEVIGFANSTLKDTLFVLTAGTHYCRGNNRGVHEQIHLLRLLSVCSSANVDFHKNLF